MLIPRRRTMEMFSISALDLFASALGTFILLAILLFPFYLRQPSLETELQGAQAELAASGESLREAERTAETTALRKAQATAALAEARARLQEAQAAAAAAAVDLEQTASAVEQQPAADRQNALSINDLDLVFVMDTTGSMRNELADVQANLLGVIRVLDRLAPSLRVGFVAFKDRGDAYLTLTFPLSPMTRDNVAQVVAFVGADVGRGRRRRPRAGRRGAEGRDGDALARRGAGPDPGDRRRAGAAVGPRRARSSSPSSSGARRPTRRCRARSRRSSPARPPAAQMFFEQIAQRRRRRLQRLSGADHRERALVGAERSAGELRAAR